MKSPLLQAIQDVVVGVESPAVIELKEDDAGSSCPPVVIKKSGPALVLKLDQKGAEVFPFFKKEPNLTSVCDYLIFYEDQGNAYVLLCELKSGNSERGKTKATGQIENTKLLADYLLNMAIHHRLKQMPPNIAYRGLTFIGRGAQEPRGQEKRTYCPYRRHSSWANVGLAILPAQGERLMSYFCHDSFSP